VLHNTEIGVVLSSEELAGFMANAFEENIKRVAFRLELVKKDYEHAKIRWHGKVDGKPVTFDVEPYTSFWQRFGIGFLSILPIESQL
jgi:putative cardiolipin synthase